MKLKFVLTETNLKLERLRELRLRSKSIKKKIWRIWNDIERIDTKESILSETDVPVSHGFMDGRPEHLRNNYFDYILRKNLNNGDLFGKLIRQFYELDLTWTQQAVALNWFISTYSKKLNSASDLFIFLGLRRVKTKLNTIEKFFQYQRFVEEQYRDLMRVDNYDLLTRIVHDAKDKYDEWVAQNKYKNLKSKADYSKIHEDDMVSIYIPNNKEAACLLGMGTRWCTAAMTSHNYYDEIHKTGDPLFILIYKEDADKPDGKIQLHFGSDEYMNKNDEPIKFEKNFLGASLEDILNDYHGVFLQYVDRRIFRKAVEKLQEEKEAAFSIMQDLKIQKELPKFQFELEGNTYIFDHYSHRRRIVYYSPLWYLELMENLITDSISYHRDLYEDFLEDMEEAIYA